MVRVQFPSGPPSLKSMARDQVKPIRKGRFCLCKWLEAGWVTGLLYDGIAMDKREREAKHAGRSQRLYKTFAASLIFLVLITLAGLIYLKSQTPAYLFINDTNQPVQQHFIGASSPGIAIFLEPGDRRFVDLPWWQSNPFIFSIKPRHNFIVYKIYRVSDFSEPWWTPVP